MAEVISQEIYSCGTTKKILPINVFIQCGGNTLTNGLSFGLKTCLESMIKERLGIRPIFKSIIVQAIEKLETYNRLINYILKNKKEYDPYIRFIMFPYSYSSEDINKLVMSMSDNVQYSAIFKIASDGKYEK